jgi:DHA1 family inner membrane transport protein
MNTKDFLDRKSILFGGFLASMTMNIMNSAYSNILDTIKGDLSLTYTLSGALMSSYFVGYALGQIPWGILADRFGSSRIMSLSVLGISASTILFSQSSEPSIAITSRFIAGLLGSGIFVPSVRLVSGWFTKGQRGAALGLLNVGGSVGLIAASWIAPLMALNIGWRATLAASGGGGVLLAVLIWLLLKEPEEKGEKAKTYNIKEHLYTKSFWILALGQFIRLGSYYTFIAWLPLLLREEYGLTLVMASTAFSLFNASGMAANPLGGIVSDRIGENVVLAASFGVLGLGVLAFTRIQGVIVYLSIFILGWFINFVRSPIFTIIPKIYGPEAAGAISGVHNTFASMGALALPLILGYVKDTTNSYNLGWISLSLLTFVGALLIYLVKSDQG